MSNPVFPINSSLFQRSIATAALCCVGLVPFTASARPSLVSSFAIPNEGGEAMTVTPDGRVVTVDSSGVVSLETQFGSGQFQNLGELPNADFSSFGVGFAAVSPDGSTLAVGNSGGAEFNNYQVGIFALEDLSGGRWLATRHYKGTWWDNRNLILSAGIFGSPSTVIVLDSQSSLADTPETTLIVEGIGGASGDVTLDAQENLLTANGFQGDGPSEAGAVHQIAASSWKAAFNSERDPVNFETEGTPLARALSGASLAVDASNNLWIGGGITFGSNLESDFVAVVTAEQIAKIEAGELAPRNSRDNGSLLRIDPDINTSSQTFSAFSVPARERVLLRENSTNNVFVYRLDSATPAPALGGLGGLALLGTGLAGSAALGRRRKATLAA